MGPAFRSRNAHPHNLSSMAGKPGVVVYNQSKSLSEIERPVILFISCPLSHVYSSSIRPMTSPPTRYAAHHTKDVNSPCPTHPESIHAIHARIPSQTDVA